MRNKIHYDYNAEDPGSPACGITGEQTWLSTDPAEVTCDICLGILDGRGSNRQIGPDPLKRPGWRFPPSLIEQVDAAAKSSKRPAQQLVRQAIEQYLKKANAKNSAR